jgi:hypothetical protein
VAPPVEQSAADEPAADAPAADAPKSNLVEGTLSADSGFRPMENGLPFANYGAAPGVVNLTPADMRRMFGDGVCSRMDGDQCILNPVADQWMTESNKGMDGGHCFGFAVFSTLAFQGKVNASSFGGSSMKDLKLEGNEALQREIAYWFVTQATMPAGEARATVTPVQALDELTAQFNKAKSGDASAEMYTIGIYQRGFKGGHAISPYAIKENTDGTASIMVYDNNFPGAEREMIIDRKANTWKYVASINPNEPEALYEGDAESGTFMLLPVAPRAEPQICTFCQQQQAGSNGGRLNAAVVEYNELSQYGDAKLMITDGEGRRLGFDGDKLINEIPDAKFVPQMSDDLFTDDPAPTWFIPRGISFTVTLDGAGQKEDVSTDFSMIGPGYTLAIEGLQLSPDQKDSIEFAPDGTRMVYKTNSSDTPLLTLGIETPANDYEFELSVAGDEDGQEIDLKLDQKSGTLAITTAGRDDTATYSLNMTRYGEQDEQSFEAADIELKAGATDYVQYGEWTGQGASLKVGFDLDNDGAIDDTIEVNDAK